MVYGAHADTRRLRVAAAFLAAAECSAAGRLADASPMSSKTDTSPMSSKMRRTIRMVGGISWSPSLFRTLQSRTDTKVPCARNSSANARDHAVFTAKHDACAWPRPFLPRLNAPPLAVWPMLGRQAGRLFAMRHGIPVGRGRSRFTFRRRFPCSLSPKLCVRLFSLGRHAIHSFRRCGLLCVPVSLCTSICRPEASHSLPNCMLKPSPPIEGRTKREAQVAFEVRMHQDSITAASSARRRHPSAPRLR
jgi:hypothetical protein